MTLKMKPASGTTLTAMASDLTQGMNVTNSQEGSKPLSFKLKVGYQLDNGSAAVTQIKVINNLPAI